MARKRLLAVPLAVAAAAALAACGHITRPMSVIDTLSPSGSPPTGSVTPAVSPTVGSTGSLTAGPSGSMTSSARASSQDQTWLIKTHQANLTETKAGELAKKQGGTGQIRSVGATLVQDHTTFDAKLKQTASQLNVQLPDTPDADQTAMLDRLAKETGQTFDKDFVVSMAKAHQQAIAATGTEVSAGSNPQVMSLAREALPVLRKHLGLVERAGGSVEHSP